MKPSTAGEFGTNPVSSKILLADVERLCNEVFNGIDPAHRSHFGQFPTPMNIGQYMASLFRQPVDHIRLLDPGAGVGSLTSAFVATASQRNPKPKSIEVAAFEIDSRLSQNLIRSLARCGDLCAKEGIAFDGRMSNTDFIAEAVDLLGNDLLGFSGKPKFNCAILNPPYKKINSESKHRGLLRHLGIETSNLYTAFLALTILLLEPEGEMVAITPRSFCNGPYFKPFRQMLLREMSLRHIHVFESRKAAFADNAVLQENIIFYATKAPRTTGKVVVASSPGPNERISTRHVALDDLVKPNDPEQFIHIVADEEIGHSAARILELPCSLMDLGLSVSTGRVVDFRCRKWLREEMNGDAVPLIYPTHFSDGWIAWPKKGSKKPNAYLCDIESSKWLVPAEIYVLTRRLTAKEERKRIVAAIFDPRRIPCRQVAFENHLNYFHAKGHGLPIELAKGLSIYLNSSIVDDCFRQFNGHTQVNASDLRQLRYPTREQLCHLGLQATTELLSQMEIDELVKKGMEEWRPSLQKRKTA
jgi:adenine-specific DNA-methyltransferase